MKYLHLMNDEKFTAFSISLFEECNANNNIFIIGRFSKQPKFSKINQAENIKNFESGSDEYYKFIEECDFDVLVVHYLDYYKCKIINKLKVKKTILWLAWGGDFYNTIFYKSSFYQPATAALLHKLENKKIPKKLKNIFREVFYFLSVKKSPSRVYKDAVKKINYCATVIPSEFTTLTGWEFFNAKQVYFSYCSIEDDFKDTDLIDSTCTGNAILIGNSISPSSNHLDVFEKLSNLNIEKRNIVVPLNYGDEIAYRDKIIEEGKNIFGDNFMPLMSFVTKHEYIKIIIRCNVAIMNHDRQQGVGNLIMLIWLGCKIFLSEKSPTFKYLKSKGFILFSFQKELNESTLNIRLSEFEIKLNRELLIKEYSHDKIIKKTTQLLDTISENTSVPGQKFIPMMENL